MFKHKFALLLLCLPFCTGCLHVEEWMTLQSDGSGKVKLAFSFPKLGLRFLPGKPDANWFKPNLPKGVVLESFEVAKCSIPFKNPQGQTQQLEGEKYSVELSFEKIADLNSIRVQPDKRNEMAAMAGGTPGKDEKAMMMMAKSKGPQVGPFQKIEWTQKNGLLHFKRTIQSARSQKEIDASKLGSPGSESTQQAYDLQDSKIQITVESPTDVVKHNADKVDGRKLTWIFKLKELQAKQDRDWTMEFSCKNKEASE